MARRSRRRTAILTGHRAQSAAGRHRADRTAVISRVRAAEHQAARQATAPAAATGSQTALVLADRKQIIQHAVDQAYPATRTSRLTYSGSGYRDGYTKGAQADLGGARLLATPPALGRGGR
jgi:hypothetical protein